MAYLKHYRMALGVHERAMHAKYGPLWKSLQLITDRERGESLSRAIDIKKNAVYARYQTPANVEKLS